MAIAVFVGGVSAIIAAPKVEKSLAKWKNKVNFQVIREDEEPKVN